MPTNGFKSRRQELYALLAVEVNKEKIAVHEAAHALHALSPPPGRPFGLRHVEIGAQWIERLHGQDDPCLVLGHCVSREIPTWRTLTRSRELAETYLVQALVGHAAEYHLVGRQSWGRCKELEGDLGRQHLIAHYALGDQEAQKAYVRWLQARATEFVQVMWPAILGVSARLVEKRKLSGEEVADILEACWTSIEATYSATQAHRGRQGAGRGT